MLKKTALALGLLAACAFQAQAATELTVYTALEVEQLKAYKEAFEKRNPDIEIKWVRDSTGIVTAKLLAEKERPQADAIWGLAGSSLAILKQQNMLEAYSPNNLEKISANYRDAANPPSWVGMDVWAATICFNTIEAEKQGLPKPTKWEDLTNPVYRGKIVMPNPASSGTGYLDVSAWLQTFGETAGWAYMDKLHANIGQYTHSGSKPCKLAAAGEFPIGISFEYPAIQLKRKGAHLEAAKKLADFSASRDAMDLYKANFAVLAQPGIAERFQELPADYEQRLVKNDFDWASQNRDKILAEWRKRYDGKSEPQPK